MKSLYVTILLCLILIATLGLVRTIDRQSEELIVLKQLYNVQREILKNNIPEPELDSMYLEYNYYYLNSYYEKNYK